jgi:hypothetical protein
MATGINNGSFDEGQNGTLAEIAHIADGGSGREGARPAPLGHVWDSDWRQEDRRGTQVDGRRALSTYGSAIAVMAWQLQKEEERLIMVATPSKGWVSDKFHSRFATMQPPLRLLITMVSGKPIDLARNVMVTKALQEKCEYIFFLDSDILVEPDTLNKLFVGNMPIISAVYYSRAPPYEMVAQVKGRGLSHEMAGTDQVREVEEVGMGCCLINCRVFHRIGQKLDWQCLMPHSEGEEAYHMEYDKAKPLNFACDKCGGALVAKFFEDRIGKAKTTAISEDFYFCKLARSFGYHVMIHLGVIVNHEMTSGFEIGQKGLINTTTSAAIVK